MMMGRFKSAAWRAQGPPVPVGLALVLGVVLVAFGGIFLVRPRS